MTLSIPHLRGLAERAYAANADDDISEADAAMVFADFAEAFSPDVCIELLSALTAAEERAFRLADMCGEAEVRAERAEAERDAAVAVLRRIAEGALPGVDAEWVARQYLATQAAQPPKGE